jgi:hypothetical protein
MPERREFDRVPLSVAAVLKSTDDIAVGRIENISLSGLYMRLQNQITVQVEDLVTVDLYLHDPDQCYSILSLHARVARIDERGMGVQFRPMAIASHNRLRTITAAIAAEDGNSDEEAFLQYQLSALEP